jgi:hypothetical protein
MRFSELEELSYTETRDLIYVNARIIRPDFDGVPDQGEPCLTLKTLMNQPVPQ